VLVAVGVGEPDKVCDGDFVSDAVGVGDVVADGVGEIDDDGVGVSLCVGSADADESAAPTECVWVGERVTLDVGECVADGESVGVGVPE